MNALDRYIGVPYVRGGRDLTGCDCYGLMRLVLADLFNCHLPLMPLDDNSQRGLWRALTAGVTNFEDAGLVTLVDPATTAGPLIVVTRGHNLATHCGLRLGLDLLHTSQQTGKSIKERLSFYRQRSGPLEYFTWR